MPVWYLKRKIKKKTYVVDYTRYEHLMTEIGVRKHCRDLLDESSPLKKNR